MSNFCAGGLWPAVQSFLTFLITNIFAHAASIHLPSGTDRKGTVLAIFTAVLTPVFLGDHAFHTIGRWGRRMRSRVKREKRSWPKIVCVIKTIFPGDTIEDAAMAGAIAIRIPDRLTDVVKDSWERVGSSQELVAFDRIAYKKPHVVADGLFSPQLSETNLFLLPPTARFKENSRYSIPASSSILTQLIAIVQLFLSSRQLYINFSGSITSGGLASPYLVVIPYLLMTLVNFVANSLVGSYPQILVLREEQNDPQIHGLPVMLEEGRRRGDETHFDGDQDLQAALREWLRQKYPSLEVSFDSPTQRRVRISRLISSLFLQSLETLIIGLLTHFYVGIASHAVWFLIWLYGMATLRFLLPRNLNPKRSPWYHWVLHGIILVPLSVGIYGGITVIVVELMEEMCESVWSISPGVWVIIGASVATSLGLCFYLILGFFGILSTHLPSLIN